MSKATSDAVRKVDPQITAMMPAWSLVDALYGGTEAMRSAGETYLPKRPLEETQDYRHRLAIATLYPALIETLSTLVGRVFAKPMVISDDVDEWLRQDVLPDVDRQGRKLEVYAYDWMLEAMRYGLSHTIIDAPRVTPRNKKEEKELKARPYFIQINPKRILGWVVKNGELLQLRVLFQEEVDDLDNFTRKIEKQIRVYSKDKIEVYVLHEKDDLYILDMEKSSPNAWGFVPLVTLYTKRTGYMTAEPPLKELAYLNAKHWMLQSSVDSLTDVAMVPILAGIGFEGTDAIKIGANHAVAVPMGGSLEYVEHTGAAISSGLKALETLKEEMRQCGAKLLAPEHDGTKTATQSREESSRENSQLGRMVRSLEDTIKHLLDYTVQTRQKDGEAKGSVKCQPNLEPDLLPNESMVTLMNMRDRSLLSDETLFNEAKRRGLVNEELTWEDEKARIGEDNETMKPPAKPADPTPPLEEEEEEGEE